MIANLIATTRKIGKVAVAPFLYIWQNIEDLWEARDTNWEDE